MTAFATPDDVGTLLQRDLTDAETDSAILMLDLLAGEIEDAIGVNFEGGTVTIEIPGNWGQWIELPSTPTSITSVAVNGTTLDTSSFFWKAGRRIRRGPDPVEQWDLIGADGNHLYQGAQPGLAVWHWGGNASTVHVVYVAPSMAVPSWIRSLCINIVKGRISNPDQVKSESLGAYSVGNNVGDAEDVNGPMLTPAQFVRLQHRYRRPAGTIIPAVL